MLATLFNHNYINNGGIVSFRQSG
ncbi:hypothetical protein FM036_10690 [Nostoc sp. HG1]|nr:hypothetical protein [Nostoc sp. HG1]